MNKHLIKFIAEQNAIADMMDQFGGGKTGNAPRYNAEGKDLTAEEKKTLLDRIESDLSPESLYQDGERPVAKAKAREKMLLAAKAALEA